MEEMQSVVQDKNDFGMLRIITDVFCVIRLEGLQMEVLQTKCFLIALKDRENQHTDYPKSFQDKTFEIFKLKIMCLIEVIVFAEIKFSVGNKFYPILFKAFKRVKLFF